MSQVGQRDYTHSAALRKNPLYAAKERLETYRDARPLTTEELDDDTLSFFLRNPATNEVLRNYVQNPLPGPDEKRIISLGFAPLQLIIQSAANVDPLALRNDLANAGVILRKNNGRETVRRWQLRQLMPQGAFDVVYAAFDDGTNAGETTELVAPTDPLQQLPDPGKPTSGGGTIFEQENPLMDLPDEHDLTLDGDEQFELEIVFGTTDGIPSDDDLIVQMGAFVEVVEQP